MQSLSRGELQPSCAARVLLALGAIAHGAVLARAGPARARQYKFAHGAEHALAGRLRLLDSYHCSRYNTQHRRLTQRCSATSSAERRHWRAKPDDSLVLLQLLAVPDSAPSTCRAFLKSLPAGRACTACSTRTAKIAVRRQGAQPQEPRRRAISTGGRTATARMAMLVAGRQRRSHGHGLRNRSAAARVQPDQAAPAALQRRCCATTRAFPTSTSRRARVSRASLLSRSRKLPGPVLRAVSERGRDARDAAAAAEAVPLRPCEDTFFANRSRPCLQYQIERCSGPCVGLIAPEDYAQDVADAIKVLEGRDTEVIDDLGRRMEQAAAGARVRERGAAARPDLDAQADPVDADRDTQAEPRTSTRSRSSDTAANTASRSCSCAAAATSAARTSSRRAASADAGEVLAAFLAQYYLGREAPAEILIDAHDRGRATLLEQR